MVKYFGDYAMLFLALIVFAFAFYAAWSAEGYAREAYFLTRDCWQEEQAVNPWVIQNSVNPFKNWTEEVDIDVPSIVDEEDSKRFPD